MGKGLQRGLRRQLLKTWAWVAGIGGRPGGSCHQLFCPRLLVPGVPSWTSHI